MALEIYFLLENVRTVLSVLLAAKPRRSMGHSNTVWRMEDNVMPIYALKQLVIGVCRMKKYITKEREVKVIELTSLVRFDSLSLFLSLSLSHTHTHTHTHTQNTYTHTHMFCLCFDQCDCRHDLVLISTRVLPSTNCPLQPAYFWFLLPSPNDLVSRPLLSKTDVGDLWGARRIYSICGFETWKITFDLYIS